MWNYSKNVDFLGECVPNSIIGYMDSGKQQQLGKTTIQSCSKVLDFKGGKLVELYFTTRRETCQWRFMGTTLHFVDSRRTW